jgi:hypothetical protein
MFLSPFVTDGVNTFITIVAVIVGLITALSFLDVLSLKQKDSGKGEHKH